MIEKMEMLMTFVAEQKRLTRSEMVQVVNIAFVHKVRGGKDVMLWYTCGNQRQ